MMNQLWFGIDYSDPVRLLINWLNTFDDNTISIWKLAAALVKRLVTSQCIREMMVGVLITCKYNGIMQMENQFAVAVLEFR